MASVGKVHLDQMGMEREVESNQREASLARGKAASSALRLNLKRCEQGQMSWCLKCLRQLEQLEGLQQLEEVPWV